MAVVTMLIALGATVAGQIRAGDSDPKARLTVVDVRGRPVREVVVDVDHDRLRVSAPGFLTFEAPLTPGNARLRVVLHRPGVILGVVRGEEGSLEAKSIRVQARAVIESSAETRSEPITARINGEKYEFPPLTPGSYQVEAVADGYVASKRIATAPEGGRSSLNLSLHRAANLNARIVDAQGKPLGKADVGIAVDGDDGASLEADQRERLAKVHATSDQEGRAVLRDLLLGQRQRVLVGREGFARRSVFVTPKSAEVRLDITLQRGATLRGQACDRDGEPVTGVYAQLLSDTVPDPDLVAQPKPTSDQSGFIGSDLASGSYSLRVGADGFVPRTVRGIDLQAGGEVKLGCVTLDRGLTLSGTVVDATDMKPIGSATLRADMYVEGRVMSIERKADARGRFALPGLVDGPLRLVTKADGYCAPVRSGVHATDAPLNLKLERAVLLTGIVVDKEGKEAVGSFKATLSPVDSSDAGTSSVALHRRFDDPDGRFRWDRLCPGAYRFEVEAHGFLGHVEESFDPADRQTAPVIVELRRGERLWGQVVDDDLGTPIEGATVESPEGARAVTGADGQFRIDGLTGRGGDLTVNHVEYASARFSGRSDKPDVPLMIRLSHGGVVTGVVKGREGQALQGASVRLVGGAPDRSAVTDEQGRYRLTGLPSGQQVLAKVDRAGTYDGYETALVHVVQGAESTHDFGGGPMVFGTVSIGGRPASDAALTFAADASMLPPETPRLGSGATRTREDGSYEIRGLMPGTYGVNIVYEGRRLGKRVAIEGGEGDHRLDIDVPDLTISGRVVDAETGEGLLGRVTAGKVDDVEAAYMSSTRTATGDIVEFSSRPQSTAVTDERGRFVLQLAEKGECDLGAWVNGYEQETPVRMHVSSTVSGLVLPLFPSATVEVVARDAATGESLMPECVAVVGESTRRTQCGPGSSKIRSARPGPADVILGFKDHALGHVRENIEKGEQEIAVEVDHGGIVRVVPPESVKDAEDVCASLQIRLMTPAGIDFMPLLRIALQFDPGWLSKSDVGWCEIRHVPSGTYQVGIRGQDQGSPLVRDIVVTDGGDATADFR